MVEARFRAGGDVCKDAGGEGSESGPFKFAVADLNSGTGGVLEALSKYSQNRLSCCCQRAHSCSET